MTKLVFNILAIIGSAGFAGVMLCIGVTLGGYWQSLSPSMFVEWFAANNKYISRAVSMIFLPAFIGIVGSLWIARKSPEFIYWGVGAGCIAGVLVLTFGYFVPVNGLFASHGLAVDRIPDKLNQWLLLHYVRIVLAAVAAILGVLALSQK